MSLKQAKGFWVPEKDASRIEMLDVYAGYPNTDIKKVDFASSVCTSRRVALDIGAHIGLTALFMAKRFGCVHAFEAAPETYKAMWVNIKASGSSNITAHNNIVGKAPGQLRFEYMPGHTQISHALLDGETPKFPDSIVTDPIGVVTIDSYDFHEVDFIKLDVEGFETLVIEGAAETIKRCEPVIVLEQRGNEHAMHGTEANEASKLLESWGMVQVPKMPFYKDRVYKFPSKIN